VLKSIRHGHKGGRGNGVDEERKGERQITVRKKGGVKTNKIKRGETFPLR